MNKKQIALTLSLTITSFFCGMLFERSLQHKYEYVYVNPTQEVDITSPKLIRAIIKAESRGNPKAISSKGCIGLMGINYRVWKDELKTIGITKKAQLFHPEINVKAGKYILAKHYKIAKGDIIKTLDGYSGKAKWYSERVLYYYMSEEE